MSGPVPSTQLDASRSATSSPYNMPPEGGAPQQATAAMGEFTTADLHSGRQEKLTALNLRWWLATVNADYRKYDNWEIPVWKLANLDSY